MCGSLWWCPVREVPCSLLGLCSVHWPKPRHSMTTRALSSMTTKMVIAAHHEHRLHTHAHRLHTQAHGLHASTQAAHTRIYDWVTVTAPWLSLLCTRLAVMVVVVADDDDETGFDSMNEVLLQYQNDIASSTQVSDTSLFISHPAN